MSWHNRTTWDQEDYVFFSVPGETEDMETVVRFTVGTCNELNVGEYRKHMRTVEAFVDQNYSFDFANKRAKAGLLTEKQIATLSKEQRGLYDAGVVTYDVLSKWAAILAGVRSVDAQDVPEGQEPVADAWEESELPAEWLEPEGFLYGAPATLVSNLFLQINTLNPGIFTLYSAGSKKKIPRVTRGSFRALPKQSATPKTDEAEAIS